MAAHASSSLEVFPAGRQTVQMFIMSWLSKNAAYAVNPEIRSPSTLYHESVECSRTYNSAVGVLLKAFGVCLAHILTHVQGLLLCAAICL